MTTTELPPSAPGRRQLVVRAAEMDTIHFAKHFTLRHADQLGGLPRLPGSITPAVEEPYRTFHDWLHRQAGRPLIIELDCGHTGRAAPGAVKGLWVSCWAVAYPQPGCQTQRKIVRVTESPAPQIEHEHEGE